MSGKLPVSNFSDTTLFFLFILNKKFKKGLVLFIPNIIYSLYFIYITEINSLAASKIANKIDIFYIMKGFILQLLTFIDAIIGPSMWLKIYYSFLQLSFPSIIIGLSFIILFYKRYRYNQRNQQYDIKLIISFSY